MNSIKRFGFKMLAQSEEGSIEVDGKHKFCFICSKGTKPRDLHPNFFRSNR
jgi:hypothetical protein